MIAAITGATGQLGAALTRRLMEEGHQVRILVRQDQRAVAGLPVTRVYGSLEEEQTLRRLMQDAEVVYHLAGLISIGNIGEAALRKTNVDGASRVVDICLQMGVRRLVHFSSIHAYDTKKAGAVVDETAPPATRFPYERSKAAAQALVIAANGRNGLETICLNPTAVLGPWDFKPSLQGRMILKLMHGRLPVITPGGFDWVDNRDVARAAAAAARQGTPGTSYLLSGQYARMIDLATTVSVLSGQRPPVLVVPFWLLRAVTPLSETWSRIRNQPVLFTRESLSHVENGPVRVSHQRAATDLGFEPRPLEETLRDSCAWFRTYYSQTDP